MEQGVNHAWDAALRAACLALIVVQNSSLILVTSYSRTLSPPYLASVAVFFAEVLKLGAAFALLVSEDRSVSRAARQVVLLIREHGWETVQFAIPALCYTLQNNLWYYALSHLDPVTAAVTSQMKVMTTAIASVIMLGRRLTALQWLSLLGLTAGLVVMQLRDEKPLRKADTPMQTPRNTISGAAAIMLATPVICMGEACTLPLHGGRHCSSVWQHERRLRLLCWPFGASRLRTWLVNHLVFFSKEVLSAYSGVYLEKLFKTVKLTLWLQSIQLSIFALPVAAICVCVYDTAEMREGSLLVGFGPVAWLAVVLNAVGGIAVSMALKYADNIQKTFAVGISIVLNCSVSAACFGVPITPRVAIGVTMVVGSTFIFQINPYRCQLASLLGRSLSAEELNNLSESERQSLVDGDDDCEGRPHAVSVSSRHTKAALGGRHPVNGAMPEQRSPRGCDLHDDDAEDAIAQNGLVSTRLLPKVPLRAATHRL